MNATLIPRANNLLYSLRLSGKAGALPSKTQALNAVELYNSTLKNSQDSYQSQLTLRIEDISIAAIVLEKKKKPHDLM